jgi:trigger factor
MGMSPGATVEAMTEKKPTTCATACSDPDHHHDHEHEHDEEFKPILCKITLLSISLPTLPEVNEDFAKKMGCTTIEEFKEKTQEYAESLAKGNQRGKLRNAMFDHLRAHYPFDVPGLLVSNEVKDYVQECLNELSPEEKTDEALKLIEDEARLLEAEIQKRVYIEYLVGHLAHQFGLKVTQQEISQDLMRELLQNPAYQDAANFEKNSEIVGQRIARDKLIEKALDFLIENAGKENP